MPATERRLSLFLKISFALALWGLAILPHLLPTAIQSKDWSWYAPAANADDLFYYTGNMNFYWERGHLPGNGYLEEHAHDSYYQPAAHARALRSPPPFIRLPTLRAGFG